MGLGRAGLYWSGVGRVGCSSIKVYDLSLSFSSYR